MVDNGNFSFYGRGERLNRAVVVHIELHYFDRRCGVMPFDRGVDEERGFARFAFSGVTDGKDHSRSIESEDLTGCLEAHACTGAGDDDSFTIEVDAVGWWGDFGLGEYAHCADEDCRVDW